VRGEPSILHVDLDAMFAAVEQRDKVSLRGRPVVVGGVAGRGVVSTASYEARAFGVRSAMPMAQARRRLPAGTAYLSPRFAAYKRTSQVVMELLGELTPLVEQVSIDEAYLDLAAGGHDLTPPGVTELALQLKRDIAAATGGVTGSVGVASSKLLAKIGSELHKPDGLTVIPAGEELTVLHPLAVGALGGVGPATEQRLHRAGVRTVGALAAVAREDLVDWFGVAHGNGLFRLARAEDNRPVVSEREAKSVSAEETFDVDLTDPARLQRELDLLAARVAGRLRSSGLTGRTVNIKVRHPDFTTVTRAVTRDQPTDDGRLIAQLARRLLAELDTSGGVRLLGVGVSTLAGFAQDDLFTAASLEGFFGAEPARRPTDLVADEPAMSTIAVLKAAEPLTEAAPSLTEAAPSLTEAAPSLTEAAPSPAGPAPAPSPSPSGTVSAGTSPSPTSPSEALPDEGLSATTSSAATLPTATAPAAALLATEAEAAVTVPAATAAAEAAATAPAATVTAATVTVTAATVTAATVTAATVTAATAPAEVAEVAEAAAGVAEDLALRVWRPGQDVRHDEHGSGWVWGSGLGRVTVRFEGPLTPPGPVRTFAVGDPRLHPADPPDWHPVEPERSLSRPVMAERGPAG
jgi:DNA polymerase-4